MNVLTYTHAFCWLRLRILFWRLRDHHHRCRPFPFGRSRWGVDGHERVVALFTRGNQKMCCLRSQRVDTFIYGWRVKTADWFLWAWMAARKQ